jgi:hypothetical protein
MPTKLFVRPFVGWKDPPEDAITFPVTVLIALNEEIYSLFKDPTSFYPSHTGNEQS